MRIGILALQGAFAEHNNILKKLGAETFEIRQKDDISKSFDGLIIPGGESTVMGKLLRELDLFSPIQKMIQDGLPVFGTCAGLILLANKVNGGEVQLGTMNITAQRNAYGRQLGSFSTNAKFDNDDNIPMVFIRAPYISSVSKDVKILSTVNDKIVAASQDNQLVTAFHPELTNNTYIHQYFLSNFIK
ncbi:MAG: pyridoxal 5'-phosphate synthase glutaminase subunit PdxT [Ruminococcus sp.]|nr:pyridoxal 5'-phosphate synthase glutaminase subunit PdxT [Ruminococcus sp.]